MRPFVFLSIFSAATLAAAADYTELIDNQDKRIIYTDGWKLKFIAGGSILAINDEDSGTASLTVFNTSRIAVRVFVEGSGQVVRISLDNFNYDISPLPDQQPAWTSDTLDPSVPHNIIIIKRNPGGQYLELENILATLADGNSPTTTREDTTTVAVSAPSVYSTPRRLSTIIITKTTSTSTETETPTKRPEGQSGLTSTTTTVGILVGALCLGILVGALGIYTWRKRDTHDATLHPFSKLDKGGASIIQSTGESSARIEGISREDGVETETDRDRRAGRPNGGIHPAPEGQPSEGGDTAAFPLEDAAPPQRPPHPPSDNLSNLSAPPPYTP